MRPEGNPLDLNNLPEDYARDGKQISEDTSSSPEGYRKKKSGAKESKDEPSKVYECRFCSLKFCKSQALGGHMNRHRQERETETLNKARQLVFTNDLAPGHLGYVSSGGGFHSSSNIVDPPLPFRPLFSTRLFPGNSGLISPHAPPSNSPASSPYMYTSPHHRLIPAPPAAATNDYILGRVLSGGTSTEGSNTCIGAPVVVNGGPGSVLDLALHSQDEGLTWGRR